MKLSVNNGAGATPASPSSDTSGVDMARISAILQADPIWCAYALADLQPDFLPYCYWSVAEGAASDGLVLLFTLLDPPPVISVGSADAVASALARMPLPEQIYLNVREEHLPLVEAYYDVPDGLIPMLRMGLTHPSPLPFEPHPQLVRLTRADADRLSALYAHGGPFTPDAFDPYQIDNGVFFGIESAEGELWAAGGTHIVDAERGIATIGNMYVHPAHRGQGLGSAVLQALLAEFAARGWETVVLNVDQRNVRAQRLYERHGFSVHCPFIEGIGHKRA